VKESYRKGVAIHPGPESCVASRKVAIEALTGAHAGRVLSCEIIATGVPTSFSTAEGNTAGCAIASIRRTLRSLRPQACMETPRARTGRPRSVPVAEGAAGRLEKTMSRKFNMHPGGESDSCV
jgi:RNA-directed DNA polymerase